jgi:hypothetical protein
MKDLPREDLDELLRLAINAIVLANRALDQGRMAKAEQARQKLIDKFISLGLV